MRFAIFGFAFLTSILIAVAALIATGWLLNDWAHQPIHALGRDVQPAFPANGGKL